MAIDMEIFRMPVSCILNSPSWDAGIGHDDMMVLMSVTDLDLFGDGTPVKVVLELHSDEPYNVVFKTVGHDDDLLTWGQFRRFMAHMEPTFPRSWGLAEIVGRMKSEMLENT